MGAELSRPPVAAGSLRRVGSSSALDAPRKKLTSDLPTSSSTTSLSAMAKAATASASSASASGGYASFSDMKSDAATPRAARGSAASSTGSGSKGNKLLDNALFNSIRRSRNSRGPAPPSTPGDALQSPATLVGEDHAVESLDLPMVEWEGYVTKRGHLVRNWKMRFFTLEGNLISCA